MMGARGIDAVADRLLPVALAAGRPLLFRVAAVAIFFLLPLLLLWRRRR